MLLEVSLAHESAESSKRLSYYRNGTAANAGTILAAIRSEACEVFMTAKSARDIADCVMLSRNCFGVVGDNFARHGRLQDR